jgi:hypothetical protein
MAIRKDQSDVDAAFSAMTAGDVVRSAPGSSEDHTDEGGLTVTGPDDAATFERFDRLSARWRRGELSLEGFADEMQRDELPD